MHCNAYCLIGYVVLKYFFFLFQVSNSSSICTDGNDVSFRMCDFINFLHNPIKQFAITNKNVVTYTMAVVIYILTEVKHCAIVAGHQKYVKLCCTLYGTNYKLAGSSERTILNYSYTINHYASVVFVGGCNYLLLGKLGKRKALLRISLHTHTQ